MILSKEEEEEEEEGSKSKGRRERARVDERRKRLTYSLAAKNERGYKAPFFFKRERDIFILSHIDRALSSSRRLDIDQVHDKSRAVYNS